jgi:nitronate monooxygenase
VGWLTERLGLEVPVVSAPMAGVSGGRLAAAVSSAGALGMIGVGQATTPEWITEQSDLARASGKPFGIGLFGWSLPTRPEQLDAALAARPALLSISFGPFEEHVARVRAAGIVMATQAGTLEEARAAEAAGVDVVVARGLEGGGHGRNEVGTLVLLQAVLESARVPVMAAGGISRASGLAAVLAAGAVGGWVGTAFIACPEAETTEAARARLRAAGETDTVYGRVFDVGQRLDWPPQYGGRALRNAFFDRWEGREDELAADVAAPDELREARRSADFDVAPIYAGQGVGLIADARPAAAVVAELAMGLDRLREAAWTE